MALLTSPIFRNGLRYDGPAVRDGVLDLTAMAPRPTALGGTWLAYWGGIPPRLKAPVGAARTIAVPGRWSDRQADGQSLFPPFGVVSYRLTIRGLRPGAYTLYLPTTYAASRVWIDGMLMSQRGRIGAGAASTRYRLRSHEIPIRADGSDLRIQVDMAAFLHRDNGFEEPPVFGPADPMRAWVAHQWAKVFLWLAALLLLITQGLILFYYRPRDPAPLFLALNCLFVLPQAAIFAYDNVLLIAFPATSFLEMLSFQYLCGLIGIAFLMLYTRTLFPRETWRLPFLALLFAYATLFAVQAALLSAGNTLAASYVSQVSTGTSAAGLLFLVLVLLRATLHRRDGASTFLLGLTAYAVMILLRAATTNNLLHDSQLGGLDWLPIGMLMLLFSQAILLAQRASFAIVAAEETNDDLRQLIDVTSSINVEMHLQALLQRIVEGTTRILDAERSTLFLYDEEAGELWSLVAEGLMERRIRIAADAGIAGHVFTHGETLRVAEAYADPRFNRAIDVQTGYRTASILAMPIVTRDGRRLGVLEALNRRGTIGFNEDDERRMGAFAAQAAIALDNARLFSEVVQSRNYNESILRSMSSAVITLDAAAQVAKFNAAACRILAMEETRLDGADARSLLAYGNADLVPEIDDVIATGASKLLLDVDLRNGRGETISANISIVPLVDENETAGVLVLIDDISEGKRLQGTMRRFMPQAVVEQVLDRPDELLFGSSCVASVLFADIRNFTSIAEELTPRATVDMLNEVFTDLFEAVAMHDGILDKFMGDAVMAVFGAPLSGLRDPENAVRAALQMQECLASLNRRREEDGTAPIRLGVGIASGEVVAGTMGSPKRMDYTVIGDSVNLASRLQAMTKVYGSAAIVCERTAVAVGDRLALRELDVIRVRGRRQPVRIFEVIGPHFSAGEAELLSVYAEARRCMDTRDWTGAIGLLAPLLRAYPDDVPARLMLSRARILKRKPPPQEWDGVWDSLREAA